MSEQLYALVRAGKVENVIVADDAFAASIAADWDAVVRVDGRPDRPGPGWTHDAATGAFGAPKQPTPAPASPPAPDRTTLAKAAWAAAPVAEKTTALRALAIAAGLEDQ